MVSHSQEAVTGTTVLAGIRAHHERSGRTPRAGWSVTVHWEKRISAISGARWAVGSHGPPHSHRHTNLVIIHGQTPFLRNQKLKGFCNLGEHNIRLTQSGRLGTHSCGVCQRVHHRQHTSTTTRWTGYTTLTIKDKSHMIILTGQKKHLIRFHNILWLKKTPNKLGLEGCT